MSAELGALRPGWRFRPRRWRRVRRRLHHTGRYRQRPRVCNVAYSRDAYNTAIAGNASFASAAHEYLLTAAAEQQRQPQRRPETQVDTGTAKGTWNSTWSYFSSRLAVALPQAGGRVTMNGRARRRQVRPVAFEPMAMATENYHLRSEQPSPPLMCCCVARQPQAAARPDAIGDFWRATNPVRYLDNLLLAECCRERCRLIKSGFYPRQRSRRTRAATCR